MRLILRAEGIKHFLFANHIRLGQTPLFTAGLCEFWLNKRERSEIVENLLETRQIVMRREASPTRPRTIYALA